MTYATVLENMQKCDRALRVCLGGAIYKKLKNLESKAIDLQKMIMDLRTFIQANPECTTVKKLKEINVELSEGPLAKYLKNDNDNLWTALLPLQKDCQQAFSQIRKLVSNKSGGRDLYSRMLNAKSDFTRLHFNIDAPSLEEKLMNNQLYVSSMRSYVNKIDEIMAESIYRNQQYITYADYERNTRELYSLNLIANNYSDETAKNLPECEILKPTVMWQYVGVGLEPIQIRVEELKEQNGRFYSVPGVSELLAAIQRLKETEPEDLNGKFIEQPNGDMVATEIFGDEYDESESPGRGNVPGITVTDEFGNPPRGANANMVHVDDAGFLSSDNIPEILNVAGVNGYPGLNRGHPRREHMFATNLTDEQMREKLLENSPKDDKDFLGAWTGGADALVSEKAYAKGRETPEVDLSLGGPIGYVPE